MNINARILSNAIEFAAKTKNTDKNFFLAAIALRKDGTWVWSTNSTVMESPMPSAHAEARVLKKAGQGAIIWVARVLKDRKTWAMARPCRTCSALIHNRLVSKVYYTIGPNEYGVYLPQER